jgi:peptidyl-prolyl cis-trans isomerase C
MKVRASHILVETVEQANALLGELAQGQTFGDLAKKHSRCPSGQRGGDLGEFTRGAMVPEFEVATFSLAIDQVSSPVQTQFGYHLIQRTG